MADVVRKKRKGGANWNAWTMAWLKRRGWTPWRTEQWNPFAGPINPKTGKPIGVRSDLFGFIDALAQKANPLGASSLISTQSCAGAGGDGAKHVTKILGCEHFPVWSMHTPVYVFAWRKLASGRLAPRISRVQASGTLLIPEDDWDRRFGERMPLPKKPKKPKPEPDGGLWAIAG